MTNLLTGDAGFIGSKFLRDWLGRPDESIVNPDKPTDAGKLQDDACGEWLDKHHGEQVTA